MAFRQKLQYAEKRLRKLRELLDLPMGTKTADAMWRSRLSFYISYYEKLAEQLRCCEGVPEEPRSAPDESGSLAKETEI